MTTATAEASPTTVEVGSFFECSWGYDQTNVDFYKVVGISPSGKTVKVQRWANKCDDHSGRVVPGDRPASWPKWVNRECVGETEAKIETRRLRVWPGDNRPAFTVNSYSVANLWDGRAAYQTPVGAGH